MSEEDLQQEVSKWTEMHAGPDGNIKDDEAEGAAEKIIDLEAEEGKKRKQIAYRSEMWDHYTKIFDEGLGQGTMQVLQQSNCSTSGSEWYIWYA